MEKKIVYQKEDNNNKPILIEEKNNEIKNNSINGSGSESLLNSIHSDKKEIDHSTRSSIDPIALSNNSMNISNENKNPNNNEQNNSINNSDNPNNINANMGELIESDLSEIKNISLYGSKNEINTIINMLKDKNDNEKKNDNLLDSNISQNDNENQNEENHNNKISSINNNSHNNDSKNNESNNSKKSHRLNEKNKLEIKKKIKEGYIPFFIQIKGYNAIFYYGKPDSQIKIPIQHYIKKINIPNSNNISFYYANKLIDINKTIGEFGIEKFGLIKGEIL